MKNILSKICSYIGVITIAVLLMGATQGSGCQEVSSDTIQTQQQEGLLSEGTRAVGMPNIVNFRERKEMKQIYEMRDQANFITYTYIIDLNGKLHKFCTSEGYPIPYSTQFTSPQKQAQMYSGGGVQVIPQADPNGLFSPADAEGTWVVCANPDPKGSPSSAVVYVEPRVICSPFPLKSVD